MWGALMGMAGNAGAGLMADMGPEAIEATDRFSLWEDTSMPARPDQWDDMSLQEEFNENYTAGEEADGFASWMKGKHPDMASDWATQAGLTKNSMDQKGKAQAMSLGMSQATPQGGGLNSLMQSIGGLGNPLQYRTQPQFNMNPLWS